MADILPREPVTRADNQKTRPDVLEVDPLHRRSLDAIVETDLRRQVDRATITRVSAAGSGLRAATAPVPPAGWHVAQHSHTPVVIAAAGFFKKGRT
jgi:hypothetical protein